MLYIWLRSVSFNCRCWEEKTPLPCDYRRSKVDWVNNIQIPIACGSLERRQILSLPLSSSSWSRIDSTEFPYSLPPSVLLSIAHGRSSRLHPVSAQSFLVLTGWPTLVCPWVGVHRRASLMSLSFFFSFFFFRD